MTTLDVNNIASTDTGSAVNGAGLVLCARAGTFDQKRQAITSPGQAEYLINDFDNGDYAKLKDRCDDPRYYSGDTPS